MLAYNAERGSFTPAGDRGPKRSQAGRGEYANSVALTYSPNFPMPFTQIVRPEHG